MLRPGDCRTSPSCHGLGNLLHCDQALTRVANQRTAQDLGEGLGHLSSIIVSINVSDLAEHLQDVVTWKGLSTGEHLVQHHAQGEHVASRSCRLASTLPGRLVSGMDFSEDGERMIVLTYLDAFEFRIDITAPSLGLDGGFIAGKNYRRIPLAPLLQQEAVAYVPGSGGFVYGTEAGRGRSPLMGVECLNR